MTQLEKEFKALVLESGMNIYQYDKFKKEFKNIYGAVVQTLHNISVKGLNVKGLMTLDKKDIKELNLTIGKPKTFIFCGCFFMDGRNVLLLELSETIGTYYYEEPNIYRQLKNYKIGLKVRLEKHYGGVNMVLPYDNNKNIGLFEELG